MRTISGGGRQATEVRQWLSPKSEFAKISQNSLFSPAQGLDYTEEWLETERARVVDPSGICSLASLAFPPTGPPGRSFGYDPIRFCGVVTPRSVGDLWWVRNYMSETSLTG